jgi:hypothetical protein
MNRAGALLIAFLWAAPAHEASIPYFANVKDIAIAASDRQNYVVVDAEIWTHTRPDLADIRLYDGKTQVPYILRQQRARVSNVEQSAKLLNLGKVVDHTEFDLEVSDVPEYDRIRLHLDAKNFIVTGLVYGMNAPGDRSKTLLGSSTLYDLSRENLGSNSLLKVPTSSFHYLHIQLGVGILPEQVTAAGVLNLQEKKANWVSAGECRTAGQETKRTILDCDVPEQVPLDRILFDVPANQVNFRRPVRVTNSKGLQIASGDISRVRMTQEGTTVDSESLAVEITNSHTQHFTVTIDNGDDPPLMLNAVQPLSIERRIYFDPGGKSSLKLYYGDEKLEPPVYDYAQFFQEDPNAAQAQLGSGILNPAYTGRPDERPWSERHKAVLWIAMLLAIALLSGLALRGLWTERSKET